MEKKKLIEYEYPCPLADKCKNFSKHSSVCTITEGYYNNKFKADSCFRKK